MYKYMYMYLGLEGCSQPRELWFSDILMYHMHNGVSFEYIIIHVHVNDIYNFTVNNGVLIMLSFSLEIRDTCTCV